MTTDRCARLRNPETIRRQARRITEQVETGDSPHFRLDRSALPVAIDAVERVTRRDYPDLQVPLHSRWRHFLIDGVDRAGALVTIELDRLEEARRRLDLAVISVLLDAGAGPDWAWTDGQTGKEYVRSEGLALASLQAFGEGLFSGDGGPWVDADGLQALEHDSLALVFQLQPARPLAGFETRVALLRRLGHQLATRGDVFGEDGRPGNLLDYLQRRSGAWIEAGALLATVLEALGPLWGYGPEVEGEVLGDVWPSHLLAGEEEPLIPFHKLAQWLTYSLVEPLAAGGVTVTDLDQLTGLPEYRNGGLFVDSAVLIPSAEVASSTLAVASDAVITWRALTVTLLDEVADGLRARLGLDAKRLPLGAVLQGGTWQAGREFARAKRDGGGPPLDVEAGGLVF